MSYWSESRADPVADKDARLRNDIDRMVFVEQRPQQEVLQYLDTEYASPRQRQMLQDYVVNKANSMGMKAAESYSAFDPNEHEWHFSPSKSPHSGLVKIDVLMRYSVWIHGLMLLFVFIWECCFAAGSISAMAFHVVFFLLLILAILAYGYVVMMVRRYNVRLLPEILSSKSK